MPDLQSTIAVDLAARYKKLALVVHDLSAALSDDQFWAKPFPFGNSFGHLLLHITGNLNYYIGAQIADTGYVRNRPLEFSDATRLPKTDVLKQFDEAVELTVATIASQRAEDWTREYGGTGSEAHNRFEIVLQCVTHLHHHIGQMMYLAFALKRG
jgi:uncharacterized damage-inducible protein DinB